MKPNKFKFKNVSSIYLPRDQMEYYNGIANQCQMTVSEVIRRALRSAMRRGWTILLTETENKDRTEI